MPNRGVAVGTTQEQIVPFHEDRKTLTIYNNGTDSVFLSHDPQNAAASGLPLEPGGAAVSILVDGDEPFMAVYAVASLGSQDIRIQEGYGEKGLEFMTARRKQGQA